MQQRSLRYLFVFYFIFVSLQASCPSTLAALNVRHYIKAHYSLQRDFKRLVERVKVIAAVEGLLIPFDQLRISQDGNFIFARQGSTLSISYFISLEKGWGQIQDAQNNWHLIPAGASESGYSMLMTGSDLAPFYEKPANLLMKARDWVFGSSLKEGIYKPRDLFVTHFEEGKWGVRRDKISDYAVPLNNEHTLYMGRLRGDLEGYGIFRFQPTLKEGFAYAPLPRGVLPQNIKLLGNTLDQKAVIFRDQKEAQVWVGVFGDRWYRFSRDYQTELSDAYFLSDGESKSIVFLDENGSPQIVQLNDKELPLKVPASISDRGFESMRVVKDRKQLLLWSDADAQLWDMKSGKILGAFAPAYSQVFKVSQEASYIASLNEGVLRLFDSHIQSEVEINARDAADVFFSPNEQILFLRYKDGSANTFETASGRFLGELPKRVAQVFYESWNYNNP